MLLTFQEIPGGMQNGCKILEINFGSGRLELYNMFMEAE